MARPLEKFKTEHTVFDGFTNRNVFKLISEGYIKGIIGPLSVGKESNVFLAQTPEKKVIVKIYRLETCDFNRMYDYLKYDPRYAVLKKKRREIIFAWAQREFRNLLIARDAGVRVPTPITIKHNILLMEMIGNAVPAPKLKDLPPNDPKIFAGKVVDYMRKLQKVSLVHADLSQFNILNWDDSPVFIDFSQSTPQKNPNFQMLLERDVKNIVQYFKKQGLPLSETAVLKKIMS